MKALARNVLLGAVVASAFVVTVSADGKTRTVTNNNKGTNAQGQATSTVAVYEKQ